MWKGMKKAYGVCILHLQCNSSETENITVQVFDISRHMTTFVFGHHNRSVKRLESSVEI